MRRWAVRSPCGRYRWVLGRTWAEGPRVVFVGLNPSTADGAVDDPTTRRCMGLARSWGAGGVWLVNVCGFRTKDPRVLKQACDPVGPWNTWWRQRMVGRADTCVAAWGNHGLAWAPEGLPGTWWCLGRTKLGAPRHPLYVRRDVRLTRFDPSE